MKQRILTMVSLIALWFSQPVLASAATPMTWTQSTATYKVVLDLGPVETMLTPDQAKGATTGEVMVPMMGMAQPSMTMTDQGQPVNYHLEVHLYNRATNAVVTDQLPTISITNAANVTRSLSSVMGMYGVTAGMSDFHVGNNVYLANGSYTVTVQIGSEKAVFAGVAVSASPIPVAAPVAAPVALPAALPQTGGVPFGATASLAVIGLALVGLGDRILRRSRRGS